MFESILVYGILTAVMAACGIKAYKRELSRKRLQVILDYAKAKEEADIETWHKFARKKLSFLTPEVLLCIAAFTFVFGLRYGVGVDFFHYMHGYVDNSGEDYELLFLLSVKAFKGLGLHYSSFFLFWAGIQISLLLYAFREHRFIFPYLLIFFMLGSHYLSLMNIIRQQVAACIFLASVELINKKKALWYYLTVFVAFLCHKSSILLVVIYPLLRYKDDWFRSIRWQLFFFAVALFLGFHYDLVVKIITVPFKLVSTYLGFSQYSVGILTNAVLNDRTQFGANTGLGLYVNILRYLPIILYSIKLKKYYHSSFFNMLYTMWFISILAGFVFESSIVLTRPFVFFMNLRFIMTGYFCHYCFCGDNLLRKTIAVIIILLYCLLCVNILMHGDTNTSAFTFVWQH